MGNLLPPQMVNYPPPPQVSNHSSEQVGNRPPPQKISYPSSQVSNFSSAQVVNYPPSQVSNDPSAQMGNRLPPQMVNYPPPQVSNHPSAQMLNRRPSRLIHGLGHNGIFDGSNNAKHDPLTGAIINTTSSNNNNNGNYEQSHNINRLTSGEPEIPLAISPPLSDSLFPFQNQYQHELPMTKYNDVCAI
jgi:hypothetical protein